MSTEERNKEEERAYPVKVWNNYKQTAKFGGRAVARAWYGVVGCWDLEPAPGPARLTGIHLDVHYPLQIHVRMTPHAHHSAAR